MSQLTSDNGTTSALQHVSIHWPTYLFGYGGGAVFALIIVLLSVQQGWWGFIPLMFAWLLVLFYFFGASLWMAHTYNEQHDVEQLIAWAQLDPTIPFAHIELGQKRLALRLVRYLTTGKLTVVDVYNPQLTPGAALARARAKTYPIWQADPRLIWLEGTIDLLPLPDKSVPVVTIAYTLIEFWQEGDREQLLREIYRVLKPGGRCILLEEVRHPQHVVALGPLVWRRPAAAYWHTLLTKVGFTIRKEQSLHTGLVQAYRADKPVQYQSRQLDLGF